MASSSSNVVGVHYRVGKKIGEGSFGVIFEGTNLLNNQQVAIKFVSRVAFALRASITMSGTYSRPSIGTQEERCSATSRRVPDIQDSRRLPYVVASAESLCVQCC